MTDIVDRLKAAAHNTSINTGFWQAQNATLFAEAAAEIEARRASEACLGAALKNADAEIERLRAAVLAEREACARIADPMPESAHSTPYEKQAIDIRTNIAAAIRARTEGE